MSNRLRISLTALCFLGIGFLIYGWSLSNAFVRWDDGMLIYENPAIRQISPSTLWWIFTHFDPELYIPLTFFSYQIDYLIGGIHSFQYHLDNLLLHCFNALLVFLILFRLLKHRWMALFCGLLFLVHPLNTEAVEWASGRKDVLSTFFFLGSIALYLLWQERGYRRWFVLSLLLFVCGLLSKVMIITLPVVLLLLDLAEGRPLRRQVFLEKIPYFALSVFFGFVGILGKQGVLASSTLEDKVLMAFRSIAFYVSQFFFPLHLSLLYPYIKPISITSSDIYLSILLVLALIGFAGVMWSRIRLVSIGVFFFLVTVIPTLVNFSKGAEMDLYFASDRYAYIPQIGLILAFAALVLAFAEWLQQSFDRRTVVVIGSSVGAILLLISAGLAHKQSLVWKDTRSLFLNVIQEYPDASYVAYNNLCNAERLINNLEEAIADCKKSLAIHPTAKTYSNLGGIYRKQKQYSLAHEAYDKGIALNPGSLYPHFGLGIVYAETGEYTKAEAEYGKVIAINPSFADVHVNLGALYAAEGNFERAVEQYHKALAINGFNPTALFNLAVAESELGKNEDAIKDYQRAITADPKLIAAYINLGLLLYNAGNTDAAIAEFQAVLRIDPQNASAHSALRQLGQE